MACSAQGDEIAGPAIVLHVIDVVHVKLALSSQAVAETAAVAVALANGFLELVGE
jgi:hypothetical protein